MNELELLPHVQLASDIIDLTYDGQDRSTILNALMIAAAAVLVDSIADEDGNTDNMSLLYAIAKFNTGLEKAAAFAVEQAKLYAQDASQ